MLKFCLIYFLYFFKITALKIIPCLLIPHHRLKYAASCAYVTSKPLNSRKVIIIAMTTNMLSHDHMQTSMSPLS